mmetsp:Transcript_59170/g.183732  ORF Transcript_59170/g.183732 Transcript_59170/m.183732 type:complete len:414 (-) Transcript_59170:561-1802(-)
MEGRCRGAAGPAAGRRPAARGPGLAAGDRPEAAGGAGGRHCTAPRPAHALARAEGLRGHPCIHASMHPGASDRDVVAVETKRSVHPKQLALGLGGRAFRWRLHARAGGGQEAPPAARALDAQPHEQAAVRHLVHRSVQQGHPPQALPQPHQGERCGSHKIATAERVLAEDLERDEGHVLLLGLEQEGLLPARSEAHAPHAGRIPPVRSVLGAVHADSHGEAVVVGLRGARQKVRAEHCDAKLHWLDAVHYAQDRAGLQDVAEAAVVLPEHALVEEHALVGRLEVQGDNLGAERPMHEGGEVRGPHVLSRREDAREVVPVVGVHLEAAAEVEPQRAAVLERGDVARVPLIVRRVHPLRAEVDQAVKARDARNGARLLLAVPVGHLHRVRLDEHAPLRVLRRHQWLTLGHPVRVR